MTHFERTMARQMMGLPVRSQERDKMMDFFSTVGGRQFVEVTVPALTKAIKDLTEVVKTLTDKVEQLEKNTDKEKSELEEEITR